MANVWIFLDLLNIAVYIPFLKVDEEDICKNIKILRRQSWFQNYLHDEQYQKLIVSNKHVRQVIGKFKIDKLHKQAYMIKCQNRLHKALLKELDRV
ncbi:hypothetical protein J32TS6_17260 [Virgibacillus pantothenticus]|uniref:hypothetical protein n=1 Tax=Virgibacillus pantothenticus TaxID=1473 RepID=UPI001B1A297B|nr:hypothetical protein [Virgibacillus pantothenticus]GIP63171.1 hypothetical protein J32TS6_17260 [Virgibacillus pantothenticus]